MEGWMATVVSAGGASSLFTFCCVSLMLRGVGWPGSRIFVRYFCKLTRLTLCSGVMSGDTAIVSNSFVRSVMC